MEYKLINGNSLEVLKTLEDNSIDSIVTDPPYELGFMGKSWDKTGIAHNVELWEQALRVLKPGGHLIAFSGSRTYHRMAVAIEDAGFEIRDQILWIYSQGMPKSLDISKAIDKSKPKNKEDISKAIVNSGLSDNYIAENLNVSSALVRFWRLGERTIQKEECDKLNKLLKLELELEYTEDKREIIGINKNAMSGWNTDGTTKFIDRPILKGTTEEAKKWSGYGTSLKPSHEPMVLARKPLSEKTVAENVLKWGTGAINIDECRVGTTDDLAKKNKSDNGIFGFGNNNNNKAQQLKEQGIEYGGRWPANLIHDGSDEVQSIFPDTKSFKSKDNYKGIKSEDNIFKGTLTNSGQKYNDSGNASRYFYCAKVNKKDRNDGLDENQKNHHPTVKPTDLMAYLVKLITPKGGTVLDPFNGSGSTGKACAILKDRNYKYIGIDLSQEYLDISKARIENEINKK